MAPSTHFAELHCHSHFSFLDGASAPDELVERAVSLGLSGLAITDHQGLYGVVRFVTAAQAAGRRPVLWIEIRANLAGTKSVPRFTQALLAEHSDGLVGLSGCREGEIARRLRVGDREGARAVAERYARLFGRAGGGAKSGGGGESGGGGSS